MNCSIKMLKCSAEDVSSDLMHRLDLRGGIWYERKQVVERRNRTEQIPAEGSCFAIEAETLGDTVGILAHGRLRAFGTPIFLKNKFGAGFHVTLFCDEDKIETILDLVSLGSNV